MLSGRRRNRAERLGAKAFARLLEDQGSLRLVVLNACRSPVVALAGIASAAKAMSAATLPL